MKKPTGKISETPPPRKRRWGPFVSPTLTEAQRKQASLAPLSNGGSGTTFIGGKTPSTRCSI